MFLSKNLILCACALLFRAGVCGHACVRRERRSVFGVFLYWSPSYFLGHWSSPIGWSDWPRFLQGPPTADRQLWDHRCMPLLLAFFFSPLRRQFRSSRLPTQCFTARSSLHPRVCVCDSIFYVRHHLLRRHSLLC